MTMSQGEAREVARKLSSVGAIIAVAVTRDHNAGNWESTHEWGVNVGGTWYGSVDELPNWYRDALKEASDEPADDGR